MVKQSTIGQRASKKTKKDFADELSSNTIFTAKEVEEFFPKKTDREELVTLIKIVNSNSNEKEKKAELVAQIGKVSGAVMRVVKKVTTGL